jgi:copper(I)-binding protein
VIAKRRDRNIVHGILMPNLLLEVIPMLFQKKIYLLFTLFLSPALVMSADHVPGGISVMDAYARAVPPGQLNSAIFMSLSNTSKTDRAIVRASSDAANIVELHTHSMEGGMMRMRKIDKIDIKAGSITVLKPGGLHVMLIGLTKQLQTGNEVALELVFDDGSTMQLTVPVKAVAGMMQHQNKHEH